MGGIVDSVTSIFEGPPDPVSPSETIELEKRANRLNQITPYGNINFGTMDAEGNFVPNSNYESVQMTLSPEQDFLRRQRLDLAKQFGNMGSPSMSTRFMQYALPNAGNFISNLPETANANDVLSSLAAGGNMAWMNPDFAAENQRMTESVYGRGYNLLQPDMELQREQRLADLAARGLPVGSEAFSTEMDRLDRSQQRQLENLALSSIGAGSQEAGRLFGQAATRFGLAEGQNMQDYTQGMGALSFSEQQRTNRMNEQIRALQAALAKQSTIANIEGQRAGLAGNLAQESQNFVNVPQIGGVGSMMQNQYNQEQDRYQTGINDLFGLGSGLGIF